MKYKFGITPEEREALFTKQGRVCAVCSSEEPSSKTGWHVDHCHKTNVVRGILCHHCNVLLGMARDNPDTLASAITYLGNQNG